MKSTEPRQELGHHLKLVTPLEFIQGTGDDFSASSTVRKSLLQIKGAKIKKKTTNKQKTPKPIKGSKKKKKNVCVYVSRSWGEKMNQVSPGPLEEANTGTTNPRSY